MARHPWAAEYLNSVKPRTVESYKANIKQHIKPAIGALRLSELTAVDVQRLYNGLTNKRSGEPRYLQNQRRMFTGRCIRHLKKPLRSAISGTTRQTSPTCPRFKRPR